MKIRLNYYRIGALLCAFFTVELHAQLPNAWQITDNSTAGGSFLNYTVDLSPEQHVAATSISGGFHYTINARFITNYAGTKSMAMGYGLGTKRFLLWFNLDGNGALTVELEGAGAPIPITPNGAGGATYHTHEIIFDGSTATATYRFDGSPVVTGWTNSATALPAGQIYWGAGSSAGKGQMNFHSVSFSVTNEVLADYGAGTEGNPLTASPPDAFGWTLNIGAPATFVDVSPDTAVLPMPTTLGADQFTPNSARLNGQVKPSGSATTAWFEWGTDTNYGSMTSPQPMGQGVNTNNLSAILGGLAADVGYHFRLIASNAFGTVTGVDRRFSINFLETPIAGLPGVFDSSLAWGDYDNDGRLDFFLSGYAVGTYVSQLWRNTGSGFTNVTASVAPGLPGVYLSSAAWGDYDNDGHLDLLLIGKSLLAPVSQIWRNTGSGFSNVTASVSTGLQGVFFSSAAWGDYDNDGRLDFLLTGTTDAISNFISQIWRNTGSGFSNVRDSVAPGLPGVYFSSVAWGDYDNDGRLDFLLTGKTNPLSTAAIAQLWRNTGNGFTNVTASVAPGLPGVFSSSVAWGDYDNDGRLDFLLTGFSSTEYVSQLWRNTGNGFTNATASVMPGLPGAGAGSVAWGDYNNDGRLDFLVTGLTLTGPVSQLWRNTGSGFTNVTASLPPDLPGVFGFSVGAWGDYDNDGRLDFLLTGKTNQSTGGGISQLWRNNLPITNAPPAAPTGLALTATTNTVMLSWNSATDDHTPASGLTYNVRAGSTPGGIDLFAGHVDAANGFRHVPALGNAYLRHSLPLTGLTNGQTVYWSVQAVDTSFAGGPFAAETSVVTIPQLTITPSDATNAIISWAPPTFGWHLEEAPDFDVLFWENSVSGEENPTTVPSTNSMRLYRLKNQ